VRARLRSRLGISVSIAAAIAVAVGLLCGLPAAASLSSTASIVASMPDAATSDGWLEVRTRVATDADAQDAAARAVIDRLLSGEVEVETVRVGDPGTDGERVAWRLTPTAEALDVDGVQRLARGLARVPEAIRESDAAEGGIVASGGLADIAADVALGVAAAAAITPVPIVILGVLAWFAVLQLARLLGTSRGREARVLTARGLSTRQDVGLAALEAGAIVGAGAVVGVAVASGVVAATWGAPSVAALASTWPFIAAAILVFGVTLVVAQLRGARTAAGAASIAGRIARAASPGAAVLLVLLAGVLVWQAGELPPGARDSWAAAVTALAPTLGVAAVAVLAVMLFAPLSALVARAAGSRPRVTPSYPARQVARRVRAFSVAVALVAIAMAGAVLAGAYGATWEAASTASQQVSAGAPLRVALDPVTPADVVTAQDAAGVSAAAPAVVAPIAAGDLAGTLVALPPTLMPEVVFDVPGAVDPDALAEATGTPSLAAGLPAEATGLRFEASVATPTPAAAAAMQVRAWLTDATSTPVEVALDVTATDDDGAIAVVAQRALPAGTAPWRLVAVEVAQGRAFLGSELVLTALRVQATTGADGGAGGGEAEPIGGVVPVESVRLHPAVPGGAAVRSAMVWTAGGEDPPRVPAVVTCAYAAQLGLESGDDVDVRFDDGARTVAVTVAAVTDALPLAGSGAGVLLSLDAMVDSASSTAPAASPGAGSDVIPPLANQVWAAGDAGAAASLGEALGAPVATVGSPASAVAGEVVTLWDAAALGGAVLAGVALVALLAALAAQRAGEVLVLRALGVAPRGQARMRGVEAVVVVGLGAVLGVAGGALLAALLVPRMAERAIPDVQVAPALGFSPWPIAAALIVVGVALAVAIAGSSAAVRRQGASTRIEEAAP
jgi:hypothetical protein